MPQEFWTYRNNNGQEFSVSIYHGEVSGHLILYCGEEILKIDFNVTSDKNYPFMLEDELFELQIKFHQDKTRYFLVNKNSNCLVEYTNRSMYHHSYQLTSIGIFIIILSFFIVMVYFFTK